VGKKDGRDPLELTRKHFKVKKVWEKTAKATKLPLSWGRAQNRRT